MSLSLRKRLEGLAASIHALPLLDSSNEAVRVLVTREAHVWEALQINLPDRVFLTRHNTNRYTVIAELHSFEVIIATGFSCGGTHRIWSREGGGSFVM
jgi:hypothetical protein